MMAMALGNTIDNEIDERERGLGFVTAVSAGSWVRYYDQVWCQIQPLHTPPGMRSRLAHQQPQFRSYLGLYRTRLSFFDGSVFNTSSLAASSTPTRIVGF